MVAATMSIVGVVFAADKPAGTYPPTVDGLLDDSYEFYRHFEGGSSFAPGDLYISEPITDDACYWALVVPRYFNENVFSDEKAYTQQFGWPGGHTFFDLYESDGAQFEIVSGAVTYTVWLDYLNTDGNGYKSGQTGDGWLEPVAEPISSVATSLYYDMTDPRSNWTDATESPPMAYNDPPSEYYWEWQMIYEFSAAKTDGQCALVTWAGAHNSPTKNDDGNNDLASLGDYVWLDADGDGLQDDGESGVLGVTVNLYYSNTETSTWEVWGTTQTNENGYYYFTSLEPGDYYVQFVAPDGYDFTLQDQGGDNARDSDVDPGTGKTGTITLNYNDFDITWDAGLVTGGTTAVRLSSFSVTSERNLGSVLLLAVAAWLATGVLVCSRRRAGRG
jgi:hypothetical protein